MYKFFSTLSFIILMAFSAKAQNLSLYSKDTLAIANTAANAVQLKEEEKKVILLMNLARLDGRAFMKKVVMPWAVENDEADDYYLETLYDELKSTKGLPMLKHHEKLHEAAAFHAHDMGNNGGLGHDSSNGTKMLERLHRFHKTAIMNESCSYGYSSALEIVMQLLLNEGVADLGDRHNILNKDFHHVGVSVKPHRSFDSNCVLDFASF